MTVYYQIGTNPMARAFALRLGVVTKGFNRPWTLLALSHGILPEVPFELLLDIRPTQPHIFQSLVAHARQQRTLTIELMPIFSIKCRRGKPRNENFSTST
jgi:hypothetical protein